MAFIPVLKHADGTFEMFITKWGGVIFQAKKDMLDADKSGAWLCETKEIALMRARDITKMCINEGDDKAKPMCIEA